MGLNWSFNADEAAVWSYKAMINWIAAKLNAAVLQDSSKGEIMDCDTWLSEVLGN